MTKVKRDDTFSSLSDITSSFSIIELRKKIVEYHSKKTFFSTPKDLDRMKNLIISFPEFLGEKADSIYLFKVKNLMKKQHHI